jgi:undecaprenyl-diphosphatase
VEIIQAIIVGLTQGLTEFMPVSSSAHLIIVPWLLGWPDFGLAFDVALHWGTLTAVLAYFGRDIVRYVWAFLTGLPRFTPADRAALVSGTTGDDLSADRRVAWLILIATIPGAVFGWLLESKVDTSFHQAGNFRAWGIYAIAFAMIGMGLLLTLAERLHRGKGKGLTAMTLPDSVVIGLSQALALLPGVSRSGATITAALFRNLTRVDAARFSFLLSAPIIFGAGLKAAYELISNPATANPQHVSFAAIAAGFVTAAVSGYLVIRFLLDYLQRRTTMVFVYYRLIVGLLIILIATLGLR